MSFYGNLSEWRKVVAFHLLHKQSIAFIALSGAALCLLRSLYRTTPPPPPLNPTVLLQVYGGYIVLEETTVATLDRSNTNRCHMNLN